MSWAYTGDVGSLCYGGTFVRIDPQAWKWGYAEAVRVTDLDSACGFRGAVLIESVTVNGTDDKGRIQRALACVGLTARDLLRMRDNTARRLAIADALLAYGYCDYERSEVVQTEAGAPMADDGWRAEKFITSDDLRGYVEAEWLE